jgi:thiamine pyrophosphokinase
MCITAVTNGSVSFTPEAAGRVSVFCAGFEASGVTLAGLKYPLNNATLTSNYPLGVSNEFIGEPSTVTVRDGALLIMWSGDPDALI